MKRTLLLFLLLPLLSFGLAHKFYVSATDIAYNEKQRSLQIISHVFTDDIEDLLKTRYNKELYLVKEGEHPAADEFLKKYFFDKLQISVNGKERKLTYLGKEYDKDQLLVYIEVEDVEAIKNISVKNAVLTDIFPEQKNVIKVEYGGKIKSLLLMREELEGTLKFGN
ncbi:DUF6702 family protein [Salinimicrobium oceani]|uniref:Peptidase E n=1 Tax=Salinimicrobium oceani TaxID=2722702 RepID=A0ABX1CYI9_9FLAO|nr:DUF6702 family protein [Salinimicrobium oceani]NJW51883.1 hypothetical protein [Salinimicrobium oceani]